MAVMRLGNGRSGPTLLDALVTPGIDTIILGEGEHYSESVYINSVRILGDGDPRGIHLFAAVEVRGEPVIAGLSLHAPHYSNALYVKTNGATATLDSVYVHGDPTGKYPALYSSDFGRIVMRRCVVVADPEVTSTTAQSNGKLDIADSVLGCTTVNSATATLTNVRATILLASERARVQTRGFLELTPPAGKRALVARSESVLDVDQLVLRNRATESMCANSALSVRSVVSPPELDHTVRLGDDAIVNVPPNTLRLVKPEPPAPAGPPAPKVVLWTQADAHSFHSKIAPQLRPGDTLLLDEGEYFLGEPGHEDVITTRVDIAGKGSADKTSIHGTVVVPTDARIKLSNLTLLPSEDQNALRVLVGGHAEVTAVDFGFPANLAFPSVYVEGELVADNCVVFGDGNAHDGLVQVDTGGSLTATGCRIGWLEALNKSRVELTECTGFSLIANSGASIVSHGVFTCDANTINWRHLVAYGGEVTCATVTGPQNFEVYVADGTLRLDDYALGDGGIGSWIYGDGATCIVRGQDITGSDPAPPRPEPSEPEPEPGDETDPLTAIDALTGLRQVKRQIRDFTTMVTINQLRAQQGLKPTPISMHSMFLGNPGTGKTTVARLLGKALYRAGAIEKDLFVEAQRSDLVSENIGGTALKTNKVLESARGGVLFIDEAYSLKGGSNQDYGSEAVAELIAFMENNRNDVVIIFAGYTDKMQDFLALNPGIKSRVPNRFDFEDYTPDEVAEIGYQALLGDDYTVDEALYRRTVADRYAQASERSNGRWVRNFNEALYKEFSRRLMSELHSDPQGLDPDTLRTITADDIYALLGGDSAQKEANVDLVLSELDALIGLEPVKRWAHELVAEAKANQRLAELDASFSKPAYHMVFSGNPGTGKTTVAKLVAKLFYNLGVLETSHVVETDRAQLVGSWIGHTEANTTRVLDEAMGGVLFLDEAYQLYVEQSPNDFGKAAIETLLPRLENDRDAFVAIFAGYTDEMQRFLDANPGLRSRIPRSIEFPDYTPAEIGQIVVAQLSAWTIDAEHTAEVAARCYDRLPARDRGNGRWARTFAERVESLQRQRIATAEVADGDISTIPPAVVDAAAAQLGLDVRAGNDASRAERVQALLAELDGMVGLAAVKDWVRRLVNRVEVERRRAEFDGNVARPAYHMVFAGNPGTGKTTVARIIAELFFNLGILSTPTVKEVDRSALIGVHIGETERNTTAAVDAAIGGVLFVDEAYQLDVPGTGNDFGRQAIETLIPRLENDRAHFVAIFAGYTADMDRFLDANAGLRSRVPLRLEFPDYTPDEIGEIVVRSLRGRWRFDEDRARAVAADRYRATAPAEQSNGRWARTFVERVEAEQMEYLAAQRIGGAEMTMIGSFVWDAV